MIYQFERDGSGKVISETVAGPLENHIVWPYGDDEDAEEYLEPEGPAPWESK